MRLIGTQNGQLSVDYEATGVSPYSFKRASYAWMRAHASAALMEHVCGCPCVCLPVCACVYACICLFHACERCCVKLQKGRCRSVDVNE
eukprot:5903919-Pleurochrysis_carterae.AAC.3